MQEWLAALCDELSFNLFLMVYLRRYPSNHQVIFLHHLNFERIKFSRYMLFLDYVIIQIHIEIMTMPQNSSIIRYLN